MLNIHSVFSNVLPFRFDEWIPASRALPDNEENRRRQIEQNESAACPKKDKLKRKSATKSPPKVTKMVAPKRKSMPNLKEHHQTTPITDKKKRKSVPVTADVDVSPLLKKVKKSTSIPTPEPNTAVVQPEIKEKTTPQRRIRIPEGLKEWMFYDWDSVTRKHRLHAIPAKTTVQDIMNAYNAVKAEQMDEPADNGTDANIPADDGVAITQRTISDSLVEYFDAMLGKQLLYRNDQPQHQQVVLAHPDVPMSRLYGPYHLLRLFERLNQTLDKWSTLSADNKTLAVQHMDRFLIYLDKNSSSFLSKQCWAITEDTGL